MGERNDLIERLRGTIADADSDIAGELLDAETPGEPFDPDDWQVEVPVGWLREAVGTIASLSEALAEAEKKGAEDWQPIETAPRDGTLIIISAFVTRAAFDHDAMAHIRRKDEQPTVCQAYFSADLWQTGDFTFAHENDATHWRPLPAPPRDLSQGDQHG